jgi:hypothetical protein
MNFKLTYATMFDPPGQLHERFEAALGRVRSELGRVHAKARTALRRSHGSCARPSIATTCSGTLRKPRLTKQL